MSRLQRLLSDVFREFGETTGVVLPGSGASVSYRDLAVLESRVRNRLRGRKGIPASRVCSWAPLGVEGIVVSWACLLSGDIFVPLDHTCSPEVIGGLLSTIRPTHLFLDGKRLSGIRSHPAVAGVELILYEENAVAGEDDRRRFSRWLEGPDAEAHDAGSCPDPVADEHPAVILFTSGSNGTPKGVVLSHHALAESADLFRRHFGITTGDLFLGLADLHTMSGFRNTCLAVPFAGGAVALAEEAVRNSAIELPGLVTRIRPAFLGASPVVIRQLAPLLERADPACFSSLRAILTTGGILHPASVQRVFAATGVPVLNYYGLTETAGICAGHSLSSFTVEDGGIGRALGARLEIVDDAGTILPDGKTGQLRVKSDRLFSGYYGHPESAGQLVSDGWLLTGDLAERTPDGRFFLHGRVDNAIKNVFTELVCCEEIELGLERHADVTEAGVVPFLADDGEETLGAVIVSRREIASAEVEGFFAGLNRFLAKTLGPRKTVQRFALAPGLPRGSGGKLQRMSLKDESRTWHHVPRH